MIVNKVLIPVVGIVLFGFGATELVGVHHGTVIERTDFNKTITPKMMPFSAIAIRVIRNAPCLRIVRAFRPLVFNSFAS